jgi:hypothetical protein
MRDGAAASSTPKRGQECCNHLPEVWGNALAAQCLAVKVKMKKLFLLLFLLCVFAAASQAVTVIVTPDPGDNYKTLRKA